MTETNFDSMLRVAEPLGRSPKIEIISVIKITFLRGVGVEPDPVREVTAYYRADDGSPIVELDLYAADS